MCIYLSLSLSIYIYIYACTYIYIYIYVCVCVYIYIYMCRVSFIGTFTLTGWSFIGKTLSKFIPTDFGAAERTGGDFHNSIQHRFNSVFDHSSSYLVKAINITITINDHNTNKRCFFLKDSEGSEGGSTNN